MRGSEPRGTLRAVERLRHDDKQKKVKTAQQPASSFPSEALTKGARTLAIVSGGIAATLSLGLASAELYRYASSSNKADVASIRKQAEFRAIEPSTGQRKTITKPLTKSEEPSLERKHDGTWTSPAHPKATIWRPEPGKIMVCARGACTVVDSATAVAKFSEHVPKPVRTIMHILSQFDTHWLLQKNKYEAVMPVCAAMALEFARHEQNSEPDLTVEALSDEQGNWRYTPATCRLSSEVDGHLECSIRRGNTWSMQLVPLEPLPRTSDAATFGRGLRLTTRRLARPARPVMMYTV
jgi:hypothetical protein